MLKKKIHTNYVRFHSGKGKFDCASFNIMNMGWKYVSWFCWPFYRKLKTKKKNASFQLSPSGWNISYYHSSETHCIITFTNRFPAVIMRVSCLSSWNVRYYPIVTVFFFFFLIGMSKSRKIINTIYKNKKTNPSDYLNVGTRKLMDAGIIFISSKERKTLLW